MDNLETPANPRELGESYDDIVNETIDDLNETESWDGTPLARAVKKIKPTSKVFTSIWFTVVVLTLIASLGMTFYFHETQPDSITRVEAEAELKATFGEAYQWIKTFWK